MWLLLLGLTSIVWGSYHCTESWTWVSLCRSGESRSHLDDNFLLFSFHLRYLPITPNAHIFIENSLTVTIGWLINFSTVHSLSGFSLKILCLRLHVYYRFEGYHELDEVFWFSFLMGFCVYSDFRSQEGASELNTMDLTFKQAFYGWVKCNGINMYSVYNYTE